MKMAKPTHEDAVLMIQLAEFLVTSGTEEAKDWLWSDEFVPDYADFAKKYPPGSECHLRANKICSYFEMLGTLYKHELLNEDLLFDWLGVSMVWGKVRGFALGMRQATGEPRLYENFEAMAKANAEYDARPSKR
jgi:hypothetical protein